MVKSSFPASSWVLFRPLPGVARPGELVTIRYQTEKRTANLFVSYRDYVDLREAVTSSLTDIAIAVHQKMPIIISRRLAEVLFSDGSALGSRLTLRYPKGKVVEVVGIVGDVRGRAVTTAPEPWAYVPSVTPTWGTIQVRSPLPEAQVIATVREVARGIDPIVAPHDIEGFDAAVVWRSARRRLPCWGSSCAPRRH